MDMSSYLQEGAPAVPPQDQQGALINHVKTVLADPASTPEQRAQAEAFIGKYGRTFHGVAGNAATGGLSDWLLRGNGQPPHPLNPLGYVQMQPEQMDFANRMAREATPDRFADANMIGNALGIAGSAKLGAAMRGAGAIPSVPTGPPMPGGGPIGGGGLVSRLSALLRGGRGSGQTTPPSMPPGQGPGGEPQGPPQFPKIVRDTEAQGGPRGPNDPLEPTTEETEIGHYKDTLQEPKQWTRQKRVGGDGPDRTRFSKGFKKGGPGSKLSPFDEDPFPFPRGSRKK